jgi:regulator of protease activity HflC (stomatin/prohibitin superfamily)
VALHIDGVLFIEVIDPYMASYGVESFKDAVINLAQTTMRSEIGRLTLDSLF